MLIPIEVIALHDMEGNVTPLRIIQHGKEYSCGELVSKTINNYAGNTMLVFRLKRNIESTSYVTNFRRVNGM